MGNGVWGRVCGEGCVVKVNCAAVMQLYCVLNARSLLCGNCGLFVILRNCTFYFDLTS